MVAIKGGTGLSFSASVSIVLDAPASDPQLKLEITERVLHAGVVQGDPHQHPASHSGIMVPSWGEKVLSFLATPERLEEAIGDFAQGFQLLAARQGLPHARRWYYWQVTVFAVRSIWPLISGLLKLIGGGRLPSA
jgi:hypothetical protein